MLRPLRGGVGDSSRWILSAWRRPSTFFHVLLLQGGSMMASRVLLLQVEDALDLISEWNGV